MQLCAIRRREQRVCKNCVTNVCVYFMMRAAKEVCEKTVFTVDTTTLILLYRHNYTYVVVDRYLLLFSIA